MAIHPTEHDLSEPHDEPGANQALLPLFETTGDLESTTVPDTPEMLVGDSDSGLTKSPDAGDLAKTPVVNARETRASFLGNVLNTKTKKATAGGLVAAALLGGIYAANRGDNDPTVHAATPVATSTPNIPATSPQPSPSASEAAPTTENPAPTVSETAPNAELGTLAPISLDLLKSQIDPQRKQELLDTYFDLQDYLNAGTVYKYGMGDEITDSGIDLKQEHIQRLLRNRRVRDILGGKGILTTASAEKAASNNTLGNEIAMYGENASNRALDIAQAKINISLEDAVEGALMSSQLEQGLESIFHPYLVKNERPTVYTLPEKSDIIAVEEYDIPYKSEKGIFVGVVTTMTADDKGKHSVWFTWNYLMPISNDQFVGMREFAKVLSEG